MTSFKETENGFLTFFDEAGAGDTGGDDTSAGGGAGDSTGGGSDGPATFTADNWLQALPENLQTNPSLIKYGGSLEGAAQAFLSAQTTIGKDMSRIVEVPADMNDAQGVRGVLSRLGLPEDPKEYKMDVPDGTPDFLAQGPMLDGFRAKAHEVGLLPGQVAAIHGWFLETMSGAAKENETTQADQDAANQKELETQWGDALDRKKAAANFAIEQIAGDSAKDVAEAIAEAGLGVHPKFMEFLASVGESLGEDSDRSAGGPSQFGSGQTPNELISQANELTQQAIGLMSKNPMQARELQAKAQALRAKANRE